MFLKRRATTLTLHSREAIKYTSSRDVPHTDFDLLAYLQGGALLKLAAWL
jgi:hypothetical protein